MKRMTLIIIAVLLFLCSCKPTYSNLDAFGESTSTPDANSVATSSTVTVPTDPILPNVSFGSISCVALPSNTVEELVQKSTEAFRGTVTDIFFVVGIPKTGEYIVDCSDWTEEEQEKLNVFTVYKVEVEKIWFGKEESVKYVAVPGWHSSYKEEIADVLIKCGMIYPKTTRAMSTQQCRIDIPYLFVVKSGEPYCTPVTVSQFAYSVYSDYIQHDEKPQYKTIKEYLDENYS